MGKSIRVNFIYNFIKTLMSLLFPVITFTYASRILEVNGYGKVSFAQSFIQYFIMIAVMGINNYGIREAARRRDNKDELSKFVQEMLIINFVTTIVSYFILLMVMTFGKSLQDYKLLILINSLAIALTSMGIEWLYSALEEYKYITLRSIAFQLIALILMFVFVKDPSDYLVYAGIHVLATSGSYVMNLLHCRKFIYFCRFKDYQLKIHIKPIFLLFAMTVSINLYTALDSTMCGLLAGDRAVGLYAAGVKVNKMVNTLIASLGVVLMPRLSYYIASESKEQFHKLAHKAYDFVFLLSIPAAVGLFSLSNEIITIFCGEKFVDAAITMKILTPIVLIIPISVLTNNQIFIPMYKEKLILISTCSGAVVNFACNMVLIPRLAENGAAIGTIIAETTVTLICIYNVSKFFSIKKLFARYWQYWVAALPIILIKRGISTLFDYNLVVVLITVLSSGIVYFTILLVLRNSFVLSLIDRVKLNYLRDR